MVGPKYGGKTCSLWSLTIVLWIATVCHAKSLPSLPTAVNRQRRYGMIGDGGSGSAGEDLSWRSTMNVRGGNIPSAEGLSSTLDPHSHQAPQDWRHHCPSTRGGAISSKAITTIPPEAAWLSGLKNSMASALAAASSKLLLAPLDTIKTFQQHERTAVASMAPTMRQTAQSILARPGGILEFYAGIGVAMIGSMPSVGLYFGIYSFCKNKFSQYDKEKKYQILTIAMSAAIGNTVASAARVPYEVVKQKLQTQVYANLADAIRDLSWKALFPTGGIASQMLRDIPYAVVTLLTYEHLKHAWKPRAEQKFPQVPNRSWDLLVGGLAGGLGSYVTNPMDVIKTRLQTSSEFYSGSIRTCFQMTLEEGGPAAFLRGSIPRLLHKVPANALFFLFYELFRTILQVQDDRIVTTSSTKKNAQQETNTKRRTR